MPFEKKVIFEPGMCEEVFEVSLEGEELEVPKKEDMNEETMHSLIFTVKLYDPVPEGVHITKKSMCTIELLPEDYEIENEEADKLKLIEYFVEQNDDSWPT